MAQTKLEALTWAKLAAALDIRSLKGFLEEFPKGAHAGDAKSKLVKLGRRPARPEWRRSKPF
jgi:hypothetical protein